ncbi:protein SMAX1-LIKE 6-like [Andrographis paniculata]|uniref:protein SMAX1-LIKE 6-like n=1 Tax=Andrographis paniculata TaxID=175694 RepID=UPI0021E9670D|nr:protein SMAX1-LIKE 6-like [Andrographis paniculata]XP_051143172.1 protein SMAX1-LIKE 6-like [Andrographis paniculata]
MPTAVSAARQCLTQEAGCALDDAVAVARRRGHAQTTSLHMVSSLLSLPRSALREACTRTRTISAYSSRVQFKALELSLSVSLDRLPSSQQGVKIEEPPVSNSLMAAIKRSQASQRRQPENYSFYQQQQQQYASCSSAIPVVKVELQNLIISILDDPLVSRVFAEAGFRSSDIKLATLRPPGNSTFHAHHLFGYCSRYKRTVPPLFLCNLTASGNESITEAARGGRGFSFPFMGCFSADDENSRRIGEIMSRDKKRCPLLLGVSAGDALTNFLETVQKRIKGILPEELNGLRVVCIKDEISRYLNGDSDEGPLKLRFGEMERLVMEERVTGAGVVVNLGFLNALAGDAAALDRLNYLVRKLADLQEVHRGRFWLIGAAATHEVHSKVLSKFPTIDEDWDLEILPMTSLKFSMGGGTYPRSSLMGSFVPLGGFFSMPSETQSSVSNNAWQYTTRCHLCNEKCEQEIAAVSNGGSCGEQCKSSLPSWLQNAELNASVKGKDDTVLLNAKIMSIRKKWDGVCQQHHLNQSFSKGLTQQIEYRQHPCVLGFQVVGDDTSCVRSNRSNESSNEAGNKNVSSSLSTDLQQGSSLKGLSSLDALSMANNRSISSELLSDSKASKFYVKDPKTIYAALARRVHQQEDAINDIVETITQCRTKPTSRKSLWINCRGPDRLGKKKLAIALAELLYGSTESLVYIDLSFPDEISQTDAVVISQVTNKYEITMRGTVVDYLVEKLSKKPSIVFIENIDNADMVVQNSLSQAMKTDRFIDVRGREASVSNCIFFMTTSVAADGSERSYGEEDILKTKGSGSIQVSIGFDLNDGPASLMNKRKLLRQSRAADEHGSAESTTKRPHKSSSSSNSCPDLNLPAEESEVAVAALSNAFSDSGSDDSMASSWRDDVSRQVDRTVVFKAFDFDGVAEKLFDEMDKCLRDVAGSECSIEVEKKVMRQVVAAAYAYGGERVEGWIREVLGKGVAGAVEKLGVKGWSVVKVDASEDVDSGEALLPSVVVVK